MFFQLKALNEVFGCSSGHFVRKEHVCNGVAECPDASDEAQCQNGELMNPAFSSNWTFTNLTTPYTTPPFPPISSFPLSPPPPHPHRSSEKERKPSETNLIKYKYWWFLIHVVVLDICRDEEGQILILKGVWKVIVHTYGKPCKNSTFRMTKAVHWFIIRRAKRFFK